MCPLNVSIKVSIWANPNGLNNPNAETEKTNY